MNIPGLLALLVLSSATSLVAQADMTQGQTTPGVPHTGPAGGPMQDASSNSIGGVDSQGLRDRLFLRRALQSNAAATQLARLALDESGNEAVKQLAQHMLEDHSAITQSLKPFADNLGVLPPAPLRQDTLEYDRLQALSGAEFDREFLGDVARSHRRDLQEYTQETGSANDVELRETVARDQAVLARHLRQADRLTAAMTASARASAAGNK